MEKGIIKEIWTQDANGHGLYCIDICGEEYNATMTIKDAHIGKEMLLTLNENGEIISGEASGKISGLAKFILDNAKGIGPARVKDAGIKLYTSIMQHDVDGVIKELSTNEGVAKSIIDYAKNNKTELDLYLLTNGQCSKAKIEKIIEQFGNKAEATIRNNPYLLTQVGGIGFLEADKIALASGVKKDSVERITEAIVYTLQTAAYQQGHCYLTNDQVYTAVLETLVQFPKQIGKAKERACKNALADWHGKKVDFIKKYKVSDDETLIMDGVYAQKNSIESKFSSAITYATENKRVVVEDDKIFLKKIYECEVNVAQTLKEMLAEENFVHFTDEDIKQVIERTDAKKRQTQPNFETTEEQANAVRLAAKNKVCIISGGPGRGKTTISLEIATLYEDFYEPGSVLMMAPTGKAAQRITESTGYPATTIHAAIMQERPQNKLILADEQSMLDIFLLDRFLKWGRNCNIVFSGDVNQIASIGPGKVLHDMISSGTIPCIILEKGHRNTGAIAKNIEAIKDGTRMNKLVYDNTFRYIPVAKNYIQKSFLMEYEKLVRTYGKNDVMAIMASNVGILSVGELNKQIQDKFKQGEPIRVGENVFYVGDRVMQTKNNYKFETNKGLGVFNGEQGTVTQIYPGMGLAVTFDDGKIGKYSIRTAAELTLSYVITMHKCQGSEAPHVVIAGSFQNAFLMNRNLLYTAISRAKKSIVLISEQRVAPNGNYMQNALDFAIFKTDDGKRQTTLKEKLA